MLPQQPVVAAAAATRRSATELSVVPPVLLLHQQEPGLPPPPADWSKALEVDTGGGGGSSGTIGVPAPPLSSHVARRLRGNSPGILAVATIHHHQQQHLEAAPATIQSSHGRARHGGGAPISAAAVSTSKVPPSPHHTLSDEKFVDACDYFAAADYKESLRRHQQRWLMTASQRRQAAAAQRLSTSLPAAAPPKNFYYYYEEDDWRARRVPTTVAPKRQPEVSFAAGLELEIPLRRHAGLGGGGLRPSLSADGLLWAAGGRRRPSGDPFGRDFFRSASSNVVSDGGNFRSAPAPHFLGNATSSPNLPQQQVHHLGARSSNWQQPNGSAVRKAVSWLDRNSTRQLEVPASPVAVQRPGTEILLDSGNETPTQSRAGGGGGGAGEATCPSSTRTLSPNASSIIRSLSITELDGIDQFALFEVSTSKLGWGQSFMGTSWIDSLKQYKFVVLNRFEEVLFFGIEEHGSMSNCVTSPHKSSFKVRILDGHGQEVIQFQRLYPVRSGSKFSFANNKMKYRLEVSTACGRVLGNVEKTFDSDTYYILEDRTGECLFLVQKSCICTCPLFWDYEFKVLIPGTDTDIGEISWSYLTAEEERFNGTEISFPVDLDTTSKLMLLGVCFLLNYSRWQSPYLESIYNPRKRKQKSGHARGRRTETEVGEGAMRSSSSPVRTDGSEPCC